MKKVLAIILCIAALLSLTACGRDKDLLSDDVEYEEAFDNEDADDYEDLDEEGKVVDPFDDVELLVFGESGSGIVVEAAAFIKDAEGKTHRYTLEYDDAKNESFSNGDRIRVKFGDDYPVEKREEDLGVKLSRSETEVTVYGLHDPSCKELGEKATVNLNDYVTVISDGLYDGTGYAYIEVDYKKILRDYVTSLNVGADKEALLGSSCPFGTVYSMFFDSSYHPILPKAEDRNDYKNGDTAYVTWEVDQEQLAALKKLMNVELVYSDFTFTVEGLDPVVEVDPFEHCEITYEGKNGEATATAQIRIKPNRGVDILFDADIIAVNNGNLSNGDKIIVSIAGCEELFMREAGQIPTRTEMEVKVEGLS